MTGLLPLRRYLRVSFPVLLLVLTILVALLQVWVSVSLRVHEHGPTVHALQPNTTSQSMDAARKRPEKASLDGSGASKDIPVHPPDVAIQQDIKRRRQRLLTLKVPTPIFVLNLPKSGTYSIHKFFECGLGVGSSFQHWSLNATTLKPIEKLGPCMHRNVVADVPLLQGCDGVSRRTSETTAMKDDNDPIRAVVFADAGAMWKDRQGNRQCFYPALHGLENIAKYYPHATIVHIQRNTTQWIQSASNWKNILGRISSYCTGFPHPPETDSDGTGGATGSDTDFVNRWYEFYGHTFPELLRTFSRNHPSLTWVEGQLESPTLPNDLQKKTGIHRKCWGHHHATKDVPGMK